MMDQREGCYDMMKLCLLDLAHVQFLKTYIWNLYMVGMSSSWREMKHIKKIVKTLNLKSINYLSIWLL
jgi:hypothetical protein